MARSILYILIVILLLLALLSGIIFRFSFISFIYAFLLLILPWFGGPITERNNQRHFHLFILIIGLISFLTILSQIIFQSILLANKPYGHTLENCTKRTEILRYFGLERLDHSNPIRILRLISPDIIILVTSIICSILIRRHERNESNTSSWPKLVSFLRHIRLLLRFILVGFSAFIYPSILNSVYMIFFLVLTFLWSFSIKFGRKYALIRVLLVIYTGIHLLISYLYQFEIFQNVFQPLSLWSNITGLTAFVTINCTDSEPYFSKNLVWSDYLNPCLLLLLYFYFAFEKILFQRQRLNNPITQPREQRINSCSNIDEQNSIRDFESPEQNLPTLNRQPSSELPGDQTRSRPMISVVLDLLHAFQRHSYLYLLSLIVMLAWSITYHSLLTLIYLLWACLLWVLPNNSPEWCLKMSPFFTIYGGILLILQYISGFKLSFDKFNFVYDRQTMEQIGIYINDFQPAFISLLIKAFYMMFFWLTLRQYSKKERRSSTEENEVHQIHASTNLYLQRLGDILKKFFTKYWIFLSCGMLLLISIQNPVVIYRIIYMIFYLFFILSFHISFRFWREIAKIFYLIIIIYSMAVLIGLYIYQFEYVNEFLLKKFGKELLLSIGLGVVPSEVLALHLVTPSIFLVVTILQLHHFHSDWIQLIKMPSDKNVQPPANRTLKGIHDYAKVPHSPDAEQIVNAEPKTWLELLDKFYVRINHFCKHIIIYYSWRFSELHTYKLILLLMVLISVYQVCAFNIVFIILVTIGLIFHKIERLIYLLTLFVTSFYILVSMCYQLPIGRDKINETNIFIQNCSHFNSTFSLFPNDTAKWFGLELTTNLHRFLNLHILLIIVLTFDGIARYRQRHRCLFLSNYFRVHLIKNRFPVLFEPFTLKDPLNNTYEYDIVSYQQADESVIHFLKYLFNFIFYRFGLEVCYITTAIVVGIRLDIIAVFYTIWLGLFLILSRRSVQRLWPFYLIFLTIIFPIQYLIVVGAPPFLCFNYPWTEIEIYGWAQLKRWLFLPDYINPPLAKQLIADFFQFLFVCQQWRVFRYETNEKDHNYIEKGGSNREIISDDNIPEENPPWNFVKHRRHWFDRIKYVIFMHGAWIVLSIIYLSGVRRISLIRFGYLIPCFYFFWRGKSFFKEKVSIILRLWHYLIYYCISVIFIKTCLQVVVCIFLYRSLPCYGSQRTSSFCIFVNLFVPCLKEDFMVPNTCPTISSGVNDPCIQNTTNAILFMDGFCLILLLLQKRIFKSYYWTYIVVELNSQKELAEKGPGFLKDILEERKKEDEKHEEEMLEKVYRSFNRIKNKQQFQESNVKDAETDSIGHFEVIRSGDEYMFPDKFEEEEEDDDDDEGKQDKATIAQGQILKILTQNDTKESLRKLSTSIRREIDDQEFAPTSASEQPEILPATTIEIPSLPILEDTTSVVSKEQSKKIQKSFLIKMHLIGVVVVDYFIESFNKNCGDYAKVSRELSKLKLRQSSPQPSRFYSLFDSLFYFLMSHSEFVCYSAMVISHVISGSLLSMPLPLSIFFWAILSSRPSRTYWITVIVYTEAMIVIKYIFQFQFYPWNAPDLPESQPLSVINVIGINQQQNGVFITDLFLLLSLFVHRSILKQLGLWKEEQPSSNATAETESRPQVSPDSATNPDVVPDNQEESIRNETPKKESNVSFLKSIRNFYHQLPQESSVHDVYASMFFCDFINMIIVIAFYSQFGETTGGSVVETIKQNQVPVAFLVLLLIQFLFIIIDRALYLRRNVRGKFIFQLFQIIGVHIWLFFILPGITHIKFRDNIAAQFWYLFKCIYLGYSSIQIRLGYPKRIAGNFLMKQPNYVNRILYRIYLLIPFLLELRTIMDWIFTDTALGLSSWLQLADIYSNVYLLKCARWAEKKSQIKRGKPRPKIMKYGVGGTLLVLLILLIWFPLLFFSFTSSFYQSNPPKEVYMDVKLDGYLPIYQMTAQDIDVKKFTTDDINLLRGKIADSTTGKQAVRDTADAFLRNFDPEDIQCVNFFATSIDLWEISQPIRDIVINNLISNITVPVRFSYTITRNPPNQDNSADTAAVVEGEHIVDIMNSDIVRKNLIEILNGTIDMQTTTNFTIDKLMPRFIHVKPKAKPEEIEAFQTIFPYEYYANITMGLNCSKTIPNSTHVWWQMFEYDNNYKFNPSCSNLNDNYLTMIFFNDKVSPPNISFLAQYGIIGLYTTFVIVVARLLRTIFETSRTIMFNELPSVKRLWRLLLDISLVREFNAFAIEEQLFAKLLFLYRSPSTLIRFTKPKSK